MTDLRALSPLHEDSVLESLGKTWVMVVMDESDPYCRRALEIAGLVVEHGFDTLDAPVKRVTSTHTPVPATPCLEALYDMCPVLSALWQRWKRRCLIETRKRSGKKMKTNYRIKVNRSSTIKNIISRNIAAFSDCFSDFLTKLVILVRILRYFTKI